jgi:hypothetical protein
VANFVNSQRPYVTFCYFLCF